MATSRQTTSPRSRRNSTDSRASMWENLLNQFTQTKQDAPFADHANHEDSSDEDPIIDGNGDSEIDSDASLSPPITISSTISPVDNQSKPWQSPTKHEKLTIIINQQQNSDDISQKRRIGRNFTTPDLTWKDDQQKLTAFHFGLTALHIQFDQPRQINIEMLCLSSSPSSPFWLTFNKQKQTQKRQSHRHRDDDSSQRPVQHQLTDDLKVELQYGALTDLDHFRYSPDHFWSNEKYMSWCMYLHDKHKNGGCIEWIFRNSEKRRKKQLLLTNINHVVVVDMSEEGFDIYICQRCNMNEFEANSNNNNQRNDNEGTRSRSSSKGRNQRQSNHRSNSRPKAPPSFSPAPHPVSHQARQPRRTYYDRYQRVGTCAGSYFSTVRFSVHINPLHLSNKTKPNIVLRIKQLLSLFIEYFLEQNITVCYGKVTSDIGEKPYLFFQPRIPCFPTLITKYAWQLLSTVGYRLQLQILNNQAFIQRLTRITEEEQNADELFYRVCVYLSRMFALKPFVNIVDELEHAINESKQKRDASAYGLVSKIETNKENEAYIPSVTLTPTTIRVKPLKLCRTNRVVRANEQFGKSLYHFVLVDVRDENGRQLQAFHFRDLRISLHKYLRKGFMLMDDERQYTYLHHSQSQLRERQFWFYHHHDQNDNYGNRRNISFSDAYRWMVHTLEERNPAKYAARMALCFSTTKATVKVPKDAVEYLDNDIEVTVNGKTLTFTDGCGTMSEKLRNKIKKSYGTANDFSAVQFRYGGCKGVVSLDMRLRKEKHLYIRPSMKKFTSHHEIFEVCKLSAPRCVFLNRQAILLLDYRKISPILFLQLQQQNHLQLIRALLRNQDAQKLILQKIPPWFLPNDIHRVNIDYIREPFFRQLVISSCLQSTRDLLNRTRIRIPSNEGRNMMGIVDEYNVLKPGQVFVQFTLLNQESNNNQKNKETLILDNQKVVITKNPCHHPGDIRTFTAVDYPQLRHLKDVVIFSQQGERPAPHDISGSDLDGDEYLVLWHKDFVPCRTDNAQPYDYDSKIQTEDHPRASDRDVIANKILEIAEQDCLGRLSNLHLAYSDKFGVDSDVIPKDGVLSTIKLAGAISQEVDSGKTGYHPLNEANIRRLNDALKNERPDYMDNANFDHYKSDHILGELYRSSKRTLPGWNRLVRYHRHLRHLEVRTHIDPDEEREDEGDNQDNKNTGIQIDPSFVSAIDRNHPHYQECVEFAKKLALVYRQEMFEILNLYGLSHESDLWCRNSINSLTGELEDTAYTELEQLVTRTKTRFHTEQVIYCEKGECNDNSPLDDLCHTCRKRQQAMSVACYCECYGNNHALEDAPILSLPWLFATPLLQHRVDQQSSSSLREGPLGLAMQESLYLMFERRRFWLNDLKAEFATSTNSKLKEVHLKVNLCIFIEIVQQYMQPYMKQKEYSHWPMILSRFIQRLEGLEANDDWTLVMKSHIVNEVDTYVVLLVSEEIEDELMHNYFDQLLKTCYEKGRLTNDIAFLKISEAIILLLQKMAINQTIF